MQRCGVQTVIPACARMAVFPGKDTSSAVAYLRPRLLVPSSTYTESPTRDNLIC